MGVMSEAEITLPETTEHTGRDRGLVECSACLVNKRSWVRIPVVSLVVRSCVSTPQSLQSMCFSENGQQISRDKTTPRLLLKDNTLGKCTTVARCHGISGQSACLVKRRSWIQIPVVPLIWWLYSVGSFLERRP